MAQMWKSRPIGSNFIINKGLKTAKKSLLARFIKLYPTIQSLLSAKQLSAEEHSDVLVVSQKSLI